MARVVIHHAHHPDEGVYRLVHAEREEVTVVEHGDPQPVVTTVPVLNPDFVAAPPDDEEDTRTEHEREMFMEEERIVEGPPELIERTEVIDYDHRDIVWSADDPRWNGLTPDQIAEEQRADIRSALHGAASIAGKEAKAAERAAEAATDLGGVGEEL